MAFIAYRKVGGRKYYCKVESYREGGRVKQRVLEYYGKTDPRENPEAAPITKSKIVGTRRFGDVALLQYAADQIGMMDIINEYVPKRQGLSLGLEFFLTVAQRLTGYKPSSTKLSGWVKRTHIPAFYNFNPDRLTDNTQQYMMDKLYDGKMHIDNIFKISTALYQAALPLFGKEEDVFFYDITSTYFEGKCCPIAHLGYSRDGKDDKLQINIGMVMNGKYGIPMMTKTFEGNISDPETVIEVVYYTKYVLEKDKGLLIMDRGMDSENNIKTLDGVGYDYIIGVRSNHNFVKQLKKSTDSSSIDWELFEHKGQTIKLKKFTKNIFGKRRIVVLYYTQNTAASQSEKRKCRIDLAVTKLKEEDRLTVEKAKDIVYRVRKYVVIEKINGKVTWHIDKIAINRAEKNDGKFCMLTNKDIAPQEIYNLYFSKDKIEKCFMHMKQDVNLHPTRKTDKDHVAVDVFICSMGFLLLKIVEHLAQKEKIDSFWDELSTEAREIGLIEQQNSSGKIKFQIIPNTKIQHQIVDRFRLYKYLPVYTTLMK